MVRNKKKEKWTRWSNPLYDAKQYQERRNDKKPRYQPSDKQREQIRIKQDEKCAWSGKPLKNGFHIHHLEGKRGESSKKSLYGVNPESHIDIHKKYPVKNKTVVDKSRWDDDIYGRGYDNHEKAIREQRKRFRDILK